MLTIVYIALLTIVNIKNRRYCPKIKAYTTFKRTGDRGHDSRTAHRSALSGTFAAGNDSKVGAIGMNGMGTDAEPGGNVGGRHTCRTECLHLLAAFSGQGAGRRRSTSPSIAQIPLLHRCDFDSQPRSDPTVIPAEATEVLPFMSNVGVRDRIERQALLDMVDVVAVVVCHAA